MVEEIIDRSDSGRAFQSNNRKVRPFVQIGDMQNQFQVGIADVELGRGMGNSGVKLNRSFSFDALMRTEFVIPHKIEPKLITHVSFPQGNDNLAGAFGFQGTDKAFYYGDGAILADCAVARSDAFPFAPFLTIWI